ncbi:PIN-like domain-containing protein [Alkalihalobacillus sp. AL-G]|uniref:PIN-like domain-containing protein n=1 Tax=Alkalihalobacillus sp. AL-G TaxID=2926399 RepID=UPI00272BC349|nr:PIN-like domain-containing protein [Alkalihalobacillus sp. AL-G]WLD93786.1 PIN-like domain-containing protein [Alkalihalobacillus sp. AL-G]
MSGKWYPSIIDIIDDSVIVFDSSALLNVYRYSLVSSKRILNYIKKYEDKAWLPAQVKKEFYKNKEKVRSLNLYKNLDKKLIRQVDIKRDELLVQFSEYEKKRFSKFTDLKSQLETKFDEMNTIIKDYKNKIAEETGVYKEFIEETDSYLDMLLESEKVGDEFNLVELLEVLKEGETRYRYSLPPGYEDAKNKEGIDKFGDLIVWKQIFKKLPELVDDKYIVFVTSDTKPDWFHKNDQKEVINPRNELISEFNHFNSDKEIIIIPFENFIEEISDSTDQSDRDFLLELRLNNLVKRLPTDSFKKIIEEKIREIGVNDIVRKALQRSNSSERQHVKYLGDISHPYIENITIETNGIKVEDDEVIYYLNVITECDYPTTSYHSNIISYGDIYAELVLSIELTRKLEDNEVIFIDKFKKNPTDVTTVTRSYTDKEKYIWGSDDDHYNEDEEYIDKDVYTTCPGCGEGISNSNDAGDGFCTDCSS